MNPPTLPMSAIVFAGGIGQRLWPLSRQKTPKQFEKIINKKSTLQLSVSQLRPEFKWENIYISTNIQYKNIVEKQLPKIPPHNIILEPSKQDVAPAVGYALSILNQKTPLEPVAIVWGDCLMQQTKTYKQALFAGARYLHRHPNKIVFLGQKPRFANQNLGWIKVGSNLEDINGFQLKQFDSWHYRPDIETATKYYQNQNYCWNPGFFIVTPQFVLSQYQKYVPAMYGKLQQIIQSYGTKTHLQQLNANYPKLEKIHFDKAILEKIPPSQAAVIIIDMDWSDIGTWESLKEKLETYPSENVTLGTVRVRNSSNNMIFCTTSQLVSAIDIENTVVVVTKDAILVAKQESTPQIKKLLDSFEGTDLDKYT